jgi:multidrug efflux system membrane fusion protein
MRGIYSLPLSQRPNAIHLPNSQPGHSPSRGNWGGILRFAILWPVIFLFLGCSAETKVNSQDQTAVPVTVGSVTRETVPVEIKTIGNVEAYSAVSIKALVGGELVKVNFREGQDVQRGELLMVIDPRPLEAALKQAEANLARDMAQVQQAEANLARDLAQVKQAEANLARDMAQAKYAEEDAKRYAFLVEKNYVAKQQYDQLLANSQALAATVQADRAAIENAQATLQADKAARENAQAAVRASREAVENARLQLEYCYIRSPLNGRTGNLFLKQGNIIKANDIPIVTINQINPIYVTFSVPEQYLPEIKKYMAGGTLKVTAVIPNDERNPEEGLLSFVDNTVDTATGTIRLKGTFENRSRRLWPGQFVNVALTLTLQPNVILVPSQAVQTGQQGQYVFVVKPDHSVELRPVIVGRSLNQETVIVRGLTAGETVVTDGQLRLVPGVKVEIRKEPAGTPQKS